MLALPAPPRRVLLCVCNAQHETTLQTLQPLQTLLFLQTLLTLPITVYYRGLAMPQYFSISDVFFRANHFISDVCQITSVFYFSISVFYFSISVFYFSVLLQYFASTTEFEDKSTPTTNNNYLSPKPQTHITTMMTTLSKAYGVLS